MRKLGFNKKIIGATVGASLMPTAMESIDLVDDGPLGKATKMTMVGGFALDIKKKVF